MDFHIFNHKKNSSQWAATDDRSSQKLPCPDQWTYYKTVKESRIGFDAKAAAEDIRTHGFHLFGTEVSIKVA